MMPSINGDKLARLLRQATTGRSLTIILVSSQPATELNALGSKGVGESGCTGSLPALSNAMMSALRPFGVQGMDMPFTPAKVWAAIHPE